MRPKNTLDEFEVGGGRLGGFYKVLEYDLQVVYFRSISHVPMTSQCQSVHQIEKTTVVSVFLLEKHFSKRVGRRFPFSSSRPSVERIISRGGHGTDMR